MNHAGDNSTDNPKVRVFFALWPHAAERSALAGWQEPLRRIVGGRAMHGDTLHATLVFIGEIAPDRLEALRLAAQEVEVPRFALCFDQAHYWGHNHIAYAAPGLAPPQLAHLVDRLEERLIRHRFKLDSREYKPHVTLLRNAHWSDRSLPQMPPVCWQCDGFALVQSLPRRDSVRYRVLARFPLRPSDA